MLKNPSFTKIMSKAFMIYGFMEHLGGKAGGSVISSTHLVPFVGSIKASLLRESKQKGYHSISLPNFSNFVWRPKTSIEDGMPRVLLFIQYRHYGFQYVHLH